MTSPAAGAGRPGADLRSRLDRLATAVQGGLYCLGSTYFTAPVLPSDVLDELWLGCDVRRGVRELERLLDPRRVGAGGVG